jgi:hypothetical protein
MDLPVDLANANTLLLTMAGLSGITTLIIQFLVKPALYARAGGEEQAKTSPGYAFSVNLFTGLISLALSVLGAIINSGLPDATTWAVFVGNVIVGGLVAAFGSAGIYEAFSNFSNRGG